LIQMSGLGYTCSAGETFDSVGRDVYGDEKYAADLLCANPEYAAIMMFAGGEVLLLPVVEALPEGSAALPETAPWRK